MTASASIGRLDTDESTTTMSILLVDDDPHILDAVQVGLHGVEVSPADE